MCSKLTSQFFQYQYTVMLEFIPITTAEQLSEIFSKPQYGQVQYPNCRSCNFFNKGNMFHNLPL